MPIPHKDLSALDMLARHLRRGPRTIPRIMQLMRISERSAYRWIQYLEERGDDVVRRKGSDGLVHFSVL